MYVTLQHHLLIDVGRNEKDISVFWHKHGTLIPVIVALGPFVIIHDTKTLRHHDILVFPPLRHST